MTSMRACSRATWASTSRAIRPCVPKNMEGAGSLRLANWLYNVGAEGRHRVRHHRPRHRLRSAARQQGGAVRRHQIHLDRQRQQRGQHLRRLAHAAAITKFEDMLTQGADRRRHRRRRPTPTSSRAIINGVLGTKMQGRHRLSRRQRRRPRDGARRGAGPLRLVVVEREVDPPAMARREEVHHPGAARARQASRPAGRAADHRSRQDRRAAADPQADLRAAGDGPAVPRAARHPDGPRRGAAQGVHGHHEGQGLPRRRREGAARDHAGGRRGGRRSW